MEYRANQVREHLEDLKGLLLSQSYRAGSMRMFHFGDMRPYKCGVVGEYALHVECPWRLQSSDRIVCGRQDVFEPSDDEDVDWDTWDWDTDGNRQDRNMKVFHAKPSLIVMEVFAGDHGDIRLDLSGGHALLVFPASSQDEDWRLFRPGTAWEHLVVGGGRMRRDA